MSTEMDACVLIEIRKKILRFIEEEYGTKSELSPAYGINLFALYNSRWDDELVVLILQLEGLQEAEASETIESRIRTLKKLEERLLEKMQEIRLRRQSTK